MNGTANETEPLFSGLAADPELSELVELFVSEMPDRVKSILDRLNASDWEGVRRVVHQLKGAAGSYGFGEITPYAGRVEEAVRQGQPEEEIHQAVDSLIRMCNRARAGTPE